MESAKCRDTAANFWLLNCINRSDLLFASNEITGKSFAANSTGSTIGGATAKIEGHLSPNEQSTSYFWETTSVGDTAQLVTLFCSACGGTDQKLPLVAVLRDTLGDDDTENDRLTSVWLLSYSRPALHQQMLSAIPFFYWRVGEGPAKVNARGVPPLLDLNTLQHPMINMGVRDVLQWAMLDPSTTPIRATSRAYRTNEIDHERLHMEETISYLRNAPSGPQANGLTPAQLNTLIARLELRKTLLGGFVTERAAPKVGEEATIRYERTRMRNWKLLRESADKTGLYFETLNLAGESGRYAMLWFPLEEAVPPSGPKLNSTWKLLDLKDPWNDTRLKGAKSASYRRDLDENGNLLPEGIRGARQIELVPLIVYALDYPKFPLLLVDFRDKLRTRRHEMTQRSINEVTAGVIGISHFTNWYYYVGADIYDFIASRHGAATSQSERLDSYSQFRVKLALDRQLAPKLREQMQQRVNSLDGESLGFNAPTGIEVGCSTF